MIVSLGANKKRILAVLVLIAIAVSAFFLIPRGEKRQTFPGMTGEERLAFLTSFGWEAEAEALGKRQIPGSVSFVPGAAGLILAGEVLRHIAGTGGS